MSTEPFVIPARFCGPPRSGHGGYVAGLLAQALPGAVAVRLVGPPPLEVPLWIESSAEGARLFHDEELVAQSKVAPLELELPIAPSFAEAERCSLSFVGFRTHPFPGCFVCGTKRESGDGLRIFPGALGHDGTLAAPWIPDASLADEDGHVAPEFLWAAVDCTGGFAVYPGLTTGAAVLGELCAKAESSVRCGERCVVLGWPLRIEGRKRFAGSAIFGADGRLIIQARATWFEVPASTWT